jgi:hypothetical protein
LFAILSRFYDTNIFKLLVKSRNSKHLILALKLLTKLLKNNGPKAEPSATPDSMGKVSNFSLKCEEEKISTISNFRLSYCITNREPRIAECM